MNKLIILVAMLSLLSLAFSCVGEAAKEPTYASQKPLYANVALCQDGSKVLMLVFDESEGTGKGYDTIYADLNLNGDLTDDKAIKGTLRKYGRSNISCTFRPIAVDVPYNEKGKGVKKPWELVVNYHQFTQRWLFGLIRGETYRSLLLSGTMKLKDERGEWVYSLWAPMEPAESLTEASPIAFRGKCTLQVETKPDSRRKGNTGIAAHLTLGTHGFLCWNGGQTAKAQVRVTNNEGKTVHSDEVLSEKLDFG